jgi:hypothetical protein
MVIYVVYCMNNEDPNATCVDREVACGIAKFLENETGAEHWVVDLKVSMTLEDFTDDF